jgi:hypothetical protein
MHDEQPGENEIAISLHLEVWGCIDPLWNWNTVAASCSARR